MMNIVFFSRDNKTLCFLISTNYHLLLTLVIIKALKLEKRSIIIAQNVPCDIEQKCIMVREMGLTVYVFRRPSSRVMYFTTRFRLKKHIKKITGNNEFSLVNFRWNIDHIYWDAVGAYALSNRVMLVEDGPACYSNSSGRKPYQLIKRIIGTPFDYYNDVKIEAILVSTPSKYPKYFSGKIVGYSLDELWGVIEEKQSILKVFVSGNLSSLLDNSIERIIIFTQPLSEDGYVKENKKIEMYNQICDCCNQYGDVVLKVHPRDYSDYSVLGYKILSRDWPSEILRLMSIHFVMAVGICSSATISADADIKINVNENYLKDKRFSLDLITSSIKKSMILNDSIIP